MHPEIAKTLVAQRHNELARTAETSQGPRNSPGPSWFSRHFPRWHVSWSRTVLSSAGASGTPAGASGPAGGARSAAAGQRGSSLVIIISAHRPA
jgi:hypothetical protein